MASSGTLNKFEMNWGVFTRNVMGRGKILMAWVNRSDPVVAKGVAIYSSFTRARQNPKHDTPTPRSP